jgi:hypothetical protein
MIRAFFRLFFALMVATRLANAQPLPDRAPLSGFTLDSAGKPLANVIITLRRQDSTGPATFWGAVTASDGRGAWRFGQAEAGRYFLSAEAPGFAPLSNQIVEWKTGATPLRLRFERLVTLRLQVRAPGGALLAKTPLWLRLRGEGDVGQVTRRAVSDEAGTATIDSLLPSSYALFLTAPGGFALQNGLELRADKSLELTLTRGGALLVTVAQNGESASKLGGASLALTPENSAAATRALGSSADLNENVALLGAGGDALSLISRDGDGQIEIAALPPGRYAARLRLPGYAIPELQFVTVTAGETARLGFQLSPGANQGVSLALNLRVPGESGREINAAPDEWSLRVLPIDKNGALAPEARDDSAFSPNDNIARRALSDSNGQIRLFPLKAGRYRIFVAPRTPPSDDGAPEAASLDIDVPAAGASASLLLPKFR